MSSNDAPPDLRALMGDRSLRGLHTQHGGPDPRSTRKLLDLAPGDAVRSDVIDAFARALNIPVGLVEAYVEARGGRVLRRARP